MNDLPLTDETDHQILMHRDSHFGGSFSLMIDYYESDGKGVQADFSISRLYELQEIEGQLKQDLSDLLLSDEEKRETRLAKEKYLALRAVYETASASDLPILIADLILTEEHEPIAETEAIIAKGKAAAAPLIGLISSEEFYNPLFPGFGLAPAEAARCLGRIEAEEAIAPLFEAMRYGDFFSEEAIVVALAAIGPKAEEFLLQSMKRFPISKENERAAIALLGFKDDGAIAKACLELLQKPATQAHPFFAAYLAMGCRSLKEQQERDAFAALGQNPALSKELRQEIDEVCRSWQKKKK